MIGKILELEGVSKLSKSNLNAIKGKGCSCTDPEGGADYHPPLHHPSHKSVKACWDYCDEWRAS
ncbi:hypothetical protein [Tenacibaculum ascidiaceicola]|uniref:hypothetical protein n=1 Tax=Tenacibaculum ascidiaceicola TaxID=1699411 RepID=UPI0038943102